MLYEFVAIHQKDIVARARDRVRRRSWPSISSREIEHGVPLFLTQLSETLRLEATAAPFSSDAIGFTAARHGAELLAAGFNVAQVVHDYGDICQVITEIAVEQHAPITVEEFHTLNRCLDAAIAEAVTEHTRLTTQRRSEQEVERRGHSAHELRDLLNGALLAFHALKRGTVAINGNTGAVLGRSLTSLQDLIERTLSEVRLGAGMQRRERFSVTTFVDEIAATGVLHSEDRGIRFRVVPVDPALAVDGDPQLLTLGGNEPVAQRVQKHAGWWHGEPQGDCARRAPAGRDPGRMRRHSWRARGTCSNPSAIDAAVIAPVSASGSRSRDRPCERTAVTSVSETYPARAASSRLTCRWLQKL